MAAGANRIEDFTLGLPDQVTVFSDDGAAALLRTGEAWTQRGLRVDTRWGGGGTLSLDLTAANATPSRIHVRWQQTFPQGTRFCGDHWERAYGDLEWRGLVPERVMPWYVLAHHAGRSLGFGVKTGAGSMCSWRVDGSGVSLWCDVRNGGCGVSLGNRTLRAADIVVHHGGEGDSPFAVARAFCRKLCPDPRLPDHPVYGSNNWYYAYGNSSHREILEDAKIVVGNSPSGANRPYMTIDAGWQAQSLETENACCGGPWDRGNRLFPDMPGLAQGIRDLGARPGIWVRPLAADPGTAASRLLPVSRARDSTAKVAVLDPSIADNCAQIGAIFALMNRWGFQLIKHDWTACDVFGRWGFDYGSEMTNGGWHFADRSRTTAEITLDLFRAIRAGAKDSLVIGCNTVGHLAAGLFELQRTGDDTSGKEWERTRKMGVNTLAFRMSQHGAFFAVDADCVGLTTQVPWALNRQWLDVLARSGTPLFVSAAPAAMGPEQTAALRQAFVYASGEHPVSEPLDWLDTTCPTRWKIGSETVTYAWSAEGETVTP